MSCRGVRHEHSLRESLLVSSQCRTSRQCFTVIGIYNVDLPLNIITTDPKNLGAFAVAFRNLEKMHYTAVSLTAYLAITQIFVSFVTGAALHSSLPVNLGANETIASLNNTLRQLEIAGNSSGFVPLSLLNPEISNFRMIADMDQNIGCTRGDQLELR